MTKREQEREMNKIRRQERKENAAIEKAYNKQHAKELRKSRSDFRKMIEEDAKRYL